MQILQKILAFNLFLFLINYNFQLKYIYAYFFAVCIITRHLLNVTLALRRFSLPRVKLNLIILR